MRKYLSLENSICLVVFFLPSYLIKINFFIFPTNLLEILIGIIFLAWLFSKKSRTGFKKIFLENITFFFGFFLIFFGLLISTFLNDSWKIGLGIIKGWFLIPLVFVFMARTAVPKEKMEKIWEVYYFSSFFIAVISLVYLSFGKITYDGRLSGFFNSPNYLAMQLAPAIIIFFALFYSKKLSRQKKYLLFFSLPFILLSFYLTYSYAAWLAVALSILSILSVQKEICIKICIIILIFFSLQFSSEKFNDLINFDKRSSISSRLIIWRSSEKILQDNFVFGIGPGNFQEKYLEYQKYFPLYLEWAVPHPHNIYLAFWLSGGLLGIIGFLSLIFFWLRKAFGQKEKSFFLLASIGIMLYILLHGFFDTTYFKNDLAIVFWLCFIACKK